MAGETKQTQSKSPLLTILVILNTIVIAGIGTLQYLMFQKHRPEMSIEDLLRLEVQDAADIDNIRENTDSLEEDGILFPLESFTANLAQGEGPRRYVRMVVVLKLSSNSSEEEFQSRKPQIRDTIIGILNAKRPEDILATEGKNHLKEEMKYSINSFFH